MKTKNWFFTMAFVLAACVAVTSCGSDEEDFAPNSSGSSFNLAKGDLSGIWVPEGWSADAYEHNSTYLFGSTWCFNVCRLAKGKNEDGDRDVHAFGDWYMNDWDEENKYFVQDNNVYFKDGNYISDVQFRIENGKLIKQEYGYDGLQDGTAYLRVDDSSKNSKLAGTRWKGKNGTGQVSVEVRCLDKHICEVVVFGMTNEYFYSYDEKTGNFMARNPVYHTARGKVKGSKMTGTYGDDYTFTLTRQ